MHTCYEIELLIKLIFIEIFDIAVGEGDLLVVVSGSECSDYILPVLP